MSFNTVNNFINSNLTFFFLSAANSVVVVGAAGIAAAIKNIYPDKAVFTLTSEIQSGLPPFRIPNFTIHNGNITQSTSEIFTVSFPFSFPVIKSTFYGFCFSSYLKFICVIWHNKVTPPLSLSLSSHTHTHTSLLSFTWLPSALEIIKKNKAKTICNPQTRRYEDYFHHGVTILLGLLIFFSFIHKIKYSNVRGWSYGIMVQVLDCSLEVSEFKLHSCYYVHFRTITLRKGINPPTQLWVK